MRIVVDQQLCTGHALCAEQAPDLIVLDEEGYNRTASLVVPDDLVEQATRAFQCCPERAIRLDEEARR
jgi:ferredoxin